MTSRELDIDMLKHLAALTGEHARLIAKIHGTYIVYKDADCGKWVREDANGEKTLIDEVEPNE